MADLNPSGRLPFYRRLRRWQIVALIVLAAVLVRAWAAWQLPIDADEPVYLNAGQVYAQFIKSGNLGGILQSDVNFEHPPLVKLMYSLPYLFIEPSFDDPVQMTVNRFISVAWGGCAVLVLALIDPMAGLFLAADSMAIKYTSQVYLESFPLFAGLMALFAYRKLANVPDSRRWFWISAIFMGAVVAGKYLYGAFVIPIVGLMWVTGRRSLKEAGGYFLAAGLTFFILDPAIWIDPIGRLWGSITFHVAYSANSVDVIQANYPWYQALHWISQMVPWHPQVFFFPTLDAPILILALLGAFWEWKTRIWTILWAALALIILLAWPTHLPQYTLILIPALCLMASTGLRTLWNGAVEFIDHWNLSESLLFRPGRSFWVVLILFGLIITGFEVGHQFNRAMARKGWSTLVEGVSPLPSNAVHALAVGRDARVVIATDQGVAFWQPTNQAPWGDRPEVIDRQNSGLADDHVTAVLEDRAGNWWFGSASGVSRWNGKEDWQSFTEKDLGLSAKQVRTLLQDRNGQIWAGTSAGVSRYNGQTWKAFTQQTSGLADNAVFCMAEQLAGEGSFLWFGTLKGVSRLDPSTETWQNFDLSGSSLGWAGVSDILVDHQNRVWVATLGDGLSQWDGKTWIPYRTSNSNIPLNTVTRILETEPGVFWLGFSYATQPGGLMARFSQDAWETFTPENSGYGGNEISALAAGLGRHLWIGTAIHGLQIYQSSR